MKDTLVAGLTHEAEITVTREMLVPSLSGELPAFADMPPVLATAMMVGFIESTCIECLRGHLDAGEHTVGIHVDVSHLAATPEGMKLRAVVELERVEGRTLTFRVEAFDEAGPIGRGSHQRAVIDVDRFMKKVGEKAARHS
ncbi:thioesterase family protein [Chelativorans sp.]|uniref:thioesterase family protein n=1 Tax=Chelativorans sp. TaxID=2203393 RepID=UPI00281138CB|nr:thioesterase family protein [Chelativorans sp.]